MAGQWWSGGGAVAGAELFKTGWGGRRDVARGGRFQGGGALDSVHQR